MKILTLGTHDSSGGAARSAYHLYTSLKDLSINSEMLSTSMAKYLASGSHFDDLGTDLISLRRLAAIGIYNLQLKLKL
jgi:hypothetical protein